jgi:hypothetical protein
LSCRQITVEFAPARSANEIGKISHSRNMPSDRIQQISAKRASMLSFGNRVQRNHDKLVSLTVVNAQPKISRGLTRMNANLKQEAIESEKEALE